MASKRDEMLAKELDQAHNGVHQRQKGEEKRLGALKQTRIRRAEHLRQLRIEQIDVQFEGVRREVCGTRARAGANSQSCVAAVEAGGSSLYSPRRRSGRLSSPLRR